MKIIKKRSLAWVYLDPESRVERQLVGWVSGIAPEPPIAVWLKTYCVGWSYSNAIVHLKDDENDYTVVKFRRAEDAVLFKLQWETKPPEVTAEPASATSRDQPADPTGLTFSKSCSRRFFQCKPKSRGALAGKSIRYCWGSERNAAGFYVGYQAIDSHGTSERFARRKRKAVIEWARRRGAL